MSTNARPGHRGFFSRPLMERFWEKVEKTDSCWLWTGSLTSGGYGHIWADGHLVAAHRIAWVDEHGPILDDLDVLHHCDIKNCVRPDHLFLGDDFDNQRDLKAKGYKRPARGEANGRAKLRVSEVAWARFEHEAGRSNRSIARALGVSASTIDRIIAGTRWIEAAR